MTKLTATGIHLIASALVFLGFLAPLYFFWYPEPFFTLDASWTVIRIVIGMDLMLGPLLTFIVFKPKKPGLKFDLTVIVMMQLSSLAWGTYVAYHERPLYAVFSVDRFTLVGARHIDQDAIVAPGLRNEGWRGPRLVYTLPPRDRKENSELLERLFTEEQSDITLLAERYRLYQDYLQAIFARDLDLDVLIGDDPRKRRLLDDFLHTQGGKVEDYAFLPVEGRKRDAVLVLARPGGNVVGMIEMEPWVM